MYIFVVVLHLFNDYLQFLMILFLCSHLLLAVYFGQKGTFLIIKLCLAGPFASRCFLGRHSRSNVQITCSDKKWMEGARSCNVVCNFVVVRVPYKYFINTHNYLFVLVFLIHLHDSDNFFTCKSLHLSSIGCFTPHFRRHIHHCICSR